MLAQHSLPPPTHRSPAPAMAPDLGIPADELRERAARLVAAAPDVFARAAAEVAHVDSELPARLADAVAERAGRGAPTVG